MANTNFDSPPINDPISKLRDGRLQDVWYLWFSSFFDTLTQMLFSWSSVTDVNFQMDTNNGYIVNDTALVTLTLPLNSNQGDVNEVVGIGTTAWQIKVNRGQSIQYLGATTTPNTGKIVSSGSDVAIEMICFEDSKKWVIKNVNGAITVV